MGQSLAFICSGNICRSPMAEVVARHASTAAGLELRIESLGTGSWHEGEGMDERARRVLVEAGYVDHGHRARGISTERLEGHDLLLVADQGHRRTLERYDGGAFADRVVLLRSYDLEAAQLELADPYYGDLEDFRRCLGEVEAAVAGLLASLSR